ncbi:hypothetical protein DNX69_11310 [Rhodopseudomonas palustris]|uniref:Transcriptional regulator HTH-type FeoC domain-containing protein n=1 Tax=Rhodopseudomonas palustris TaxID=1076 RepID=A0A323UL63_RHOPL|nr:FeoC-like transcriptional regulator [Rhodopseudomonas palustris]PZA11706.1 hypothetical protein DNX69_11310 [Rhodopseudomonas palustris]
MLTLSALKSCLIDRRCASLAELALHFDSSRDAVRQALQQLEAKGSARRKDKSASCRCAGGCGCDEEVWEWCN